MTTLNDAIREAECRLDAYRDFINEVEKCLDEGRPRQKVAEEMKAYRTLAINSLKVLATFPNVTITFGFEGREHARRLDQAARALIQAIQLGIASSLKLLCFVCALHKASVLPAARVPTKRQLGGRPQQALLLLPERAGGITVSALCGDE